MNPQWSESHENRIDQRFEAVHPPHTGEWNLRIKYPQRKDSGIYECQISTTPPSSFLISVTIKGIQCAFSVTHARSLFRLYTRNPIIIH